MILRSVHVGNAIKTNRLLKKISQEKLGDQLNLTQGKGAQQISNIERGRAQLPLKHVHNLSKILEIPLDEIINLLVEDYKSSVTKELVKLGGKNVQEVDQLSGASSVGGWRGSNLPDWP